MDTKRRLIFALAADADVVCSQYLLARLGFSELLVKSADGLSLAVTAGVGTRIADVKSQIEDLQGFSVGEQKLFLPTGDDELPSDYILNVEDCRSGSCLFLVRSRAEHCTLELPTGGDCRINATYMFDIRAKVPVKITALAVDANPRCREKREGHSPCSVYFRAGTHVGHESSKDGWTLAPGGNLEGEYKPCAMSSTKLDGYISLGDEPLLLEAGAVGSISIWCNGNHQISNSGLEPKVCGDVYLENEEIQVLVGKGCDGDVFEPDNWGSARSSRGFQGGLKYIAY